MTEISERRVVFIGTATETFTPTTSGAVATVMWELSRCAQADGVEPLVIARQSKRPPHPDMPSLCFDYPKEPTEGISLLARRAQRRAMGWTRMRQGEWMARIARILHEHDLSRYPWVLNNEPELAVYLRKRFPGAFIGHLFHNVLLCKPAARRRFGGAVNFAAGVSNFIARWVEEQFAMREGSVRTLYNAVDCDRFCPTERPPPGLPVISYVGRTGSEKAPDILLKACLAISERTRAFSVQLVGSNCWGRLEMDEYQEELQFLVRDLRNRGITVRTTGHVERNRIHEEFRRAHIHVVPSRCAEAFGLSGLEGMASGLATVGSRVGGIPEVIGDAGLLFERENVTELATILEKLVSSAETRTHYADMGRRRAQSFTWHLTWNHLRECLDLPEAACTSASSI